MYDALAGYAEPDIAVGAVTPPESPATPTSTSSPTHLAAPRRAPMPLGVRKPHIINQNTM